MGTEEHSGRLSDPISLTDIDAQLIEDDAETEARKPVDSASLPQTVRVSDPHGTIPGPPPPPTASHGALPRRGMMRSETSKTLLGIEPYVEKVGDAPPVPGAVPPAPPPPSAAPVRSVLPTLPVEQPPTVPSPYVPPPSTTPQPPPPAPPPPTPLQSGGTVRMARPSAPPAGDVAPPTRPSVVADTMGEALGRRVQLGGGGVPIGALLVVGWLITVALVLALGKLLFSGEDAPPPTVSEDAPADPDRAEDPAPSSPLEELSSVRRAARGDAKALAELTAKLPSERTVEESLAVSTGTLAQRHAELADLGEQLKQNPDLLRDRKWQALIRTRAYEMDSSRQALGMLAGLPGPEGADMLYILWLATQARTDATRLAEELVKTPEVRKKASPALAVALDLRLATTCEENLALLPRAVEHGDQRCVLQLSQLKKLTGCGPAKKDDCFPCLREGKLLDDAIKEAQRRAPPRYY